MLRSADGTRSPGGRLAGPHLLPDLPLQRRAPPDLDGPILKATSQPATLGSRPRRKSVGDLSQNVCGTPNRRGAGSIEQGKSSGASAVIRALKKQMTEDIESGDRSPCSTSSASPKNLSGSLSGRRRIGIGGARSNKADHGNRITFECLDESQGDLSHRSFGAASEPRSCMRPPRHVFPALNRASTREDDGAQDDPGSWPLGRSFAAPSSLMTRRRYSVGAIDGAQTHCVNQFVDARRLQPLAMIREMPEGVKIFDMFVWDKVLQEEGNGGKVVICTRKMEAETPLSPASPASQSSTNVGVEYVLKMKSKEALRNSQAEDGFRRAHQRLLNLPQHAGVLPLREVWEDEEFYYVVMEKARGGSLFSSLLDDHSDGHMPEHALKRMTKEILEAVGFIHKQGLLHRDIKPDNLVVQVDEEPTSPGGKLKRVQLIDFDMADSEWCPDSPQEQSSYFVGTLRNSAPETLMGIFSQQSDLYSVGTILYLLMSGKLPYEDSLFEDRKAVDIYECLRNVKVDWEADAWRKQPVCADFCQRLLAFDPQDRPSSAEDALSHAWFTAQPEAER